MICDFEPDHSRPNPQPSPKMMAYAQVPSLMSTNMIESFRPSTERPETLVANLKSVRAKSVVSKASGKILMREHETDHMAYKVDRQLTSKTRTIVVYV